MNSVVDFGRSRQITGKRLQRGQDSVELQESLVLIKSQKSLRLERTWDSQIILTLQTVETNQSVRSPLDLNTVKRFITANTTVFNEMYMNPRKSFVFVGCSCIEQVIMEIHVCRFAAEVFDDLHEQVKATAARGHEMSIRVQRIEVELPVLEKAVMGQTSHMHFDSKILGMSSVQATPN